MAMAPRLSPTPRFPRGRACVCAHVCALGLIGQRPGSAEAATLPFLYQGLTGLRTQVLQHQVFSVQTIRNETFTTRGQAFMRKKGIKTLEPLLIRGTGSEERKEDDGKGRPESGHRLHLHTWLRWGAGTAWVGNFAVLGMLSPYFLLTALIVFVQMSYLKYILGGEWLHVYVWLILLLATWNYHSIVNWLYPSTKCFWCLKKIKHIYWIFCV